MTAKILVADDSITIQKIVAMAFENEDATVEGIGNGSDALARLKTFKPNIVLADINMPGLTGFELSREIKESSELNSIYVLLLASDFEEFDEDLFQASLADNHITKPFKTEDLVQKVMILLGNGSPAEIDEETEDEMEMEEVIELLPTDRVDADIVMDLGESQRTDSYDEVSFEKDTADLALDLELTGLADEDSKQDAFSLEIEDDPVFFDPPEEDLQVEVADSAMDQAESGQKEDLDELLMKVDELTRQSDKISENGRQEELSPKEAIDEMLKEVSALKIDSLMSPEENNAKETMEPQLGPDPAQSEAGLKEVDYISEENAEALASAFDEITNGNTYSFSAMTTEPSDNQEAISQEDGTASENPVEDFSAQPLSAPEEETPADNEESTSPVANGELSSSEEEPLHQVMEKEVRRILQETLTPLIEKELSGLSEKILRAVEENVRKVTPGIAKTIIEKEIEKIKTMEDG